MCSTNTWRWECKSLSGTSNMRGNLKRKETHFTNMMLEKLKSLFFFCFASGKFYKLGKLNFFLANRQSSVKVLLLRLFTTNASNSFDYFPPSLEVCKLKFFICTRIFKKRRTIKMPSWTFQLSFLASPDSQLCSSTMCEKANCIFLLE